MPVYGLCPHRRASVRMALISPSEASPHGQCVQIQLRNSFGLSSMILF